MTGKKPSSFLRITGALAALGVVFALGAVSAPRTASAEPAPEDITSCFDAENHGQCVVCCMASGINANICAKACFVINK